MDSNRLMLIVNPHSGLSSKTKLAGATAASLAAAGFDVDLRFTRGPGHARELAQQAAAEGYGTVAVCGGDGTVNEAAGALIGTSVRMGILPSGSGNGLARHLNIPMDELQAVEVLKRGHEVECDCGLANGTPFFCTFGLGFDAQVAKRFAKAGRRGRAAYVKSVINEYSSYKPCRYRITADGSIHEHEAMIVACCNASQYGNNAFIAPDASVSDGMIDIVIVKTGTPAQMLQAGIDLVTGMMPFNKNIVTLRASNISIEVEGEACAHLDGEPVEASNTIEVACRPAALRVLAQPRVEPFTPFITPIDMVLRDWGCAIAKLLR